MFKENFSAAARALGVPQSTASRTIAALERSMGASLLIRTTHAVTLTDTGADFLARVEPVLADLEEAEHAARGTGELRGLLRVGIGTALATRLMIPALKPFLDRHPALRVELMLDLVSEGVDVAFRFGELSGDSGILNSWLTAWAAAMRECRAKSSLPGDFPDR